MPMPAITFIQLECESKDRAGVDAGVGTEKGTHGQAGNWRSGVKEEGSGSLFRDRVAIFFFLFSLHDYCQTIDYSFRRFPLLQHPSLSDLRIVLLVPAHTSPGKEMKQTDRSREQILNNTYPEREIQILEQEREKGYFSFSSIAKGKGSEFLSLQEWNMTDRRRITNPYPSLSLLFQHCSTLLCGLYLGYYHQHSLTHTHTQCVHVSVSKYDYFLMVAIQADPGTQSMASSCDLAHKKNKCACNSITIPQCIMYTSLFHSISLHLSPCSHLSLSLSPLFQFYLIFMYSLLSFSPSPRLPSAKISFTSFIAVRSFLSGNKEG